MNKPITLTDSENPAIVVQEITLASGTWNYSFHAKKAEHNIIRGVVIAPNGDRGWLDFNLDSGEIVGVPGGEIVITNQAMALHPNGNEWYRCSFAFSADTLGDYFFGMEVAPGVEHDGTSGLYVWGTQVSEGGDLKDYVKTEDTPVIPQSEV